MKVTTQTSDRKGRIFCTRNNTDTPFPELWMGKIDFCRQCRNSRIKRLTLYLPEGNSEVCTGDVARRPDCLDSEDPPSYPSPRGVVRGSPRPASPTCWTSHSVPLQPRPYRSVALKQKIDTGE